MQIGVLALPNDRRVQARSVSEKLGATDEISYYFVARTDAGAERRAPLTAPVEIYRHGIREDD